MNTVSTFIIFNTAIGAWQTQKLIKFRIAHGFGYSSKTAIDTSVPLIGYANFSSKKIYTNANKFIELYTGKNATLLPKTFSASTKLENKNFDTQIDSVFNEVFNNEAIIIYFDIFAWREYLPSKAMLLSKQGLKIEQYQYGAVLSAK